MITEVRLRAITSRDHGVSPGLVAASLADFSQSRQPMCPETNDMVSCVSRICQSRVITVFSWQKAAVQRHNPLVRFLNTEALG